MKESQQRSFVSFVFIQLGILYLVFIYPFLISNYNGSLEVLAQVLGYMTLGFLFYDLWSKEGGTVRLLQLGLEYNPLIVFVFIFLIFMIAAMDSLSAFTSFSLTGGVKIIFLLYMVLLLEKTLRLRKSGARV